MALLHLGIKNIPSACRTVALHLLLAAKFNVVRKWKSNIILNIVGRTHKLSYQYLMEKLMAVKNDTFPKFLKSWNAWLLHRKFPFPSQFYLFYFLTGPLLNTFTTHLSFFVVKASLMYIDVFIARYQYSQYNTNFGFSVDDMQILSTVFLLGTALNY